MIDKKIAWERWDEDVIEQEIVEDFYEQYEDEEDQEMAEDALSFLDKIPSLVTTPMGMYQLHDKMNVMNQFDCWMGHTNFDITKSVQSKVEEIEGVELLNMMSRYRFFIGLGKLFNFSDVRKSIEEALCDPFEMDEDVTETVKMIRDIVSEDKFWTIFVSLEGDILYSSTNKENDKDYLNSLKSYNIQKNKFGGLILNNE
jgi:hypothetical protein